MENFGSQLFKNIKFRDSFVMIGQKGVAKGKAIEIVYNQIYLFLLSLWKTISCQPSDLRFFINLR
jgi:hypothetical protein